MSDIDTAAADSLKVLDPERPIREAEITDPMSGFFMLRRPAFEAAVRHLSGHGFKILLDLLASSPQPLRIKELPYQFRERRFGESKLDTLVAWEFVTLIADKRFGHLIPVRFALFTLIGGVGLLIHLVILWACFDVARLPFVWSQTIAAWTAMSSNFFSITYSRTATCDLKAGASFAVSFHFMPSARFGAMANVGVASYVFAMDRSWWLAGVAGVFVGAVWNYAVSSIFTWKV